MSDVSEDELYSDVPETDTSIKWARRETNTRDLRKSPEYKAAHDQYRTKCAVFRNPDGSLGAPCIRCDEPINYSLTHPHPRSWSLEHLIPVTERPELFLDKNNWGSAHLDCNSVAGATRVEGDLGEPSEDWDALSS